MLVRMKNGNIEDLYDEVARGFVLQGRAEYLKDAAVLHAEAQGGVAATVGIETAMLEPQKAEHAVLKFIRTLRSRG